MEKLVADLQVEVQSLKERVAALEQQIKDMPDTVSKKIGGRGADLFE